MTEPKYVFWVELYDGTVVHVMLTEEVVGSIIGLVVLFSVAWLSKKPPVRDAVRTERVAENEKKDGKE